MVVAIEIDTPWEKDELEMREKESSDMEVAERVRVVGMYLMEHASRIMTLKRVL